MKESIFDKISSEWWDKNGPMKMLHSMNETRTLFIKERIINKYQKLLVGLISGIVIVFVLYFGYDKLIYQPKVDESNAELFTAQKYFNLAVEAAETSDSLYNLSLNGADGKYGFLDIIEDYSGTPAANISNYSAGIAYFNLKKYDLAIKYLNDFSSDDEFLGTLALSTIGDSFVQLNQLDDGLNYYEKALSTTSNSFWQACCGFNT